MPETLTPEQLRQIATQIAGIHASGGGDAVIAVYLGWAMAGMMVLLLSTIAGWALDRSRQAKQIKEILAADAAREIASRAQLERLLTAQGALSERMTEKWSEALEKIADALQEQGHQFVLLRRSIEQSGASAHDDAERADTRAGDAAGRVQRVAEVKVEDRQRLAAERLAAPSGIQVALG